MNDYGNKAKLFPEAVINQSADYLFFHTIKDHNYYI